MSSTAISDHISPYSKEKSSYYIHAMFNARDERCDNRHNNFIQLLAQNNERGHQRAPSQPKQLPVLLPVIPNI